MLGDASIDTKKTLVLHWVTRVHNIEKDDCLLSALGGLQEGNNHVWL